MAADSFTSRVDPRKTIDVDAVGREAVPVIDQLARGHRSEADALMARVPPKLRRDVLAQINRYFRYEAPPAPTKRKR